ncbi:MAG: phosphoribosylpyrophosphate synthetase [Zetaproteobacteria bacterium]|nr:phosphoribosylpyrophosphate synthetase [Pseudobdellovibrionaceae bacterium]
MDSEVLLISGSSNRELSQKIASSLEVPLCKSLVTSFSDGETRVEIQQNVRGKDVYVIQSTSFPANHNVMEALIIVDACRRASAKDITLVAPYFGYARQERKSSPRTPITAKLVAELLEASGIDRLLTLELHNSAIQGFFNKPVDHLFSKQVFLQHFKRENYKDLIVISPDAGGVERSRAMAKVLGCGLAIIDKRRDKPNDSRVMHIVGDVLGKECLVVDDIVDTGGSLVKATDCLLNHGAKSVSAAISHAVLSGDAVNLIKHSNLKTLLVTDTIQLTEKAKECEKIVQISVAPLLAEAIKRVHDRDSISSLFGNE